MRLVGLLSLLLIPVTISLAQSSPSSSQPNMEVLKFDWTKERIGWEQDPFSGPIEDFNEMRARTRNEKRIEVAKSGNAADVDRIKTEAKADAANLESKHSNKRSRYVFVYEVSVKNSSNKTTRSIDWDYIFSDRDRDTEISRQQFTSEEKIAPGKNRTLKVVTTKPPTSVISLTTLNEDERKALRGEVIIVRIDYEDGTSWKAPE